MDVRPARFVAPATRTGRAGVDLGWVGSSGGHFQLRRPNLRDHRATNEDENLALYNTKTRRYLTRGAPVFGIGAKWDKLRSFEWRAHNRVHYANDRGVKFALYNTRYDDYLVRRDRLFGIDLKWYKDTLPAALVGSGPSGRVSCAACWDPRSRPEVARAAAPLAAAHEKDDDLPAMATLPRTEHTALRLEIRCGS